MKALYWKRDRGEKFQTITEGNATVKIYRRARGKGKKRRWIFEVVDRTRGPGARLLHGFGDYRAAHAKAKAIARALASGEALAAGLRNADAASFGRATELLRPTGLSLEMAAAIVAKCHEILGSDRYIEAATFFKRHGADTITPRSVPDVVAELVAAREARGKSKRYVDDLRARLRKFAQSFAVDISAVTTSDVQSWLDGLDVAPRTAKNFRGALSTLFKFAAARQYIAKGENAATDTERITTNGDGAIEIYSPEEIAALLKAAPKTFLPFIALGAFGGLRSAEIERLDWKEIDLKGGFIHVAAGKAKTRSRRLVPLLPNLTAWLSRCAGRRGLVWKGNARDLLDARAATVKAAGVAWKDNGLRHSFISYRLADIQDAAQVALEAGNSPAMVFRHYREIVRPEAARQWFAVAPEQPANVVTLKTEAAQ